MRKYIDADKLKEVFDEHEDDYGYLHGYWEEFIDNAPPADIRENVIGEWVTVSFETTDKNGEIFTFGESNKCSVCGRNSDIKFDFCPNCGAHMMRGES